MKKIYKNEVQRLFPILEAIKEGKTIQFNDSGVWRDIDGCDEGFFLDTLVGETYNYRIKPEPKYRPFKDAEECWAEMLKHQPFGYTYDWFNNIRDSITKVATTGVSYDSPTVVISFEEVFDRFVFADGVPFGVKVEE